MVPKIKLIVRRYKHIPGIEFIVWSRDSSEALFIISFFSSSNCSSLHAGLSTGIAICMSIIQKWYLIAQTTCMRSTEQIELNKKRFKTSEPIIVKNLKKMVVRVPCFNINAIFVLINVHRVVFKINAMLFKIRFTKKLTVIFLIKNK